MMSDRVPEASRELPASAADDGARRQRRRVISAGVFVVLVALVLFVIVAPWARGRATMGTLDRHTYAGTTYRLEGVPSSGTLPRLAMTFQDGLLKWTAGCNDVGTGYEIRGDTLSRNGMKWSSAVGCIGPDGEVEAAVFAFLSDQPEVFLAGDRLVMRTATAELDLQRTT